MLLDRFIPFAAVAVIASGCADQAAQIPDYVRPPLDAFDGSYRGTIQVAGVASGASDIGYLCNTNPKMAVTVVDGAFTYAQSHPRYPGNPTVTYSVNVSPGGYVTGISDMFTTLEGRVINGVMEGRINGSGCFYSFSLVRS